MMLRAREVRKKMREAKSARRPSIAGIDQELWAYVRINDLIPEIIETGSVEEEEIEMMKDFFEEKGAEKRLTKDLLDRFSIAIAQLA